MPARLMRRKSKPPVADSQTKPQQSRTEEARLDLLERVSAFVVKHSLSVTGSNMAAVCNALSGANAELSEAFVAREISGEPIDQRWLDTVTRLDPETNTRANDLEKLMDEIEYTMVRFAQSAMSAQSETSEQREALNTEIRSIETSPPADTEDQVSRVIDFSRAMVRRIEQAENAMARSQEETNSLRQNLAKARMEADVDHLTRLPNRRAFERRLDRAVREARNQGQPLSLAFCDVDHFKSVNDKHGHDAGDRVLVAIANTLSENSDDQCFVARHGGEEFVVLFHGLDKDAAWMKLEGIRITQAAKTMMNRDNGKPFGKITFSAGIAEVTDDIDPREALARADAALYTAKETGRNKVVAA